MDFGFVGCLAFSNYFKLPHVIWLNFARTAFFYIIIDKNDMSTAHGLTQKQPTDPDKQSRTIDNNGLSAKQMFLFYLPFLSSIHEKANCIAILWTGSPHSLGSCLFRGFYGPPVFHIKAGASR